jgi:hypothetical protein
MRFAILVFVLLLSKSILSQPPGEKYQVFWNKAESLLRESAPKYDRAVANLEAAKICYNAEKKDIQLMIDSFIVKINSDRLEKEIAQRKLAEKASLDARKNSIYTMLEQAKNGYLRQDHRSAFLTGKLALQKIQDYKLEQNDILPRILNDSSLFFHYMGKSIRYVEAKNAYLIQDYNGYVSFFSQFEFATISDSVKIESTLSTELEYSQNYLYMAELSPSLGDNTGNCSILIYDLTNHNKKALIKLDFDTLDIPISQRRQQNPYELIWRNFIKFTSDSKFLLFKRRDTLQVLSLTPFVQKALIPLDKGKSQNVEYSVDSSGRYLNLKFSNGLEVIDIDSNNAIIYYASVSKDSNFYYSNRMYDGLNSIPGWYGNIVGKKYYFMANKLSESDLFRGIFSHGTFERRQKYFGRKFSLLDNPYTGLTGQIKIVDLQHGDSVKFDRNTVFDEMAKIRGENFYFVDTTYKLYKYNLTTKAKSILVDSLYENGIFSLGIYGYAIINFNTSSLMIVDQNGETKSKFDEIDATPFKNINNFTYLLIDSRYFTFRLKQSTVIYDLVRGENVVRLSDKIISYRVSNDGKNILYVTDSTLLKIVNVSENSPQLIISGRVILDPKKDNHDISGYKRNPRNYTYPIYFQSLYNYMINNNFEDYNDDYRYPSNYGFIRNEGFYYTLKKRDNPINYLIVCAFEKLEIKIKVIPENWDVYIDNEKFIMFQNIVLRQFAVLQKRIDMLDWSYLSGWFGEIDEKKSRAY